MLFLGVSIKNEQPNILEESVKEISVEEQVKQISVEEPVKEISVEEPVKEISVEEPVKDISVEEPVKEISVEEPVKEISVEEPVKEISVGEPVKQISVGEPVKEISVGESVNQISVGELEIVENTKIILDVCNRYFFVLVHLDIQEVGRSWGIMFLGSLTSEPRDHKTVMLFRILLFFNEKNLRVLFSHVYTGQFILVTPVGSSSLIRLFI